MNLEQLKPLGQEKKTELKTEFYGNPEITAFGFIGKNNLASDLGSVLLGYSAFKSFCIENNRQVLELESAENIALENKDSNPSDNTSEAQQGETSEMPKKQIHPVLVLCIEDVTNENLNYIQVTNICTKLGLELGKDVMFSEFLSHKEDRTATEKENAIINSCDAFFFANSGVSTKGSKEYFEDVTNLFKIMLTETLVVAPKNGAFEEYGHSFNYLYGEPFVVGNYGASEDLIGVRVFPSEINRLMTMIPNLSEGELDSIKAMKKAGRELVLSNLNTAEHTQWSVDTDSKPKTKSKAKAPTMKVVRD